MSLRLGVDVGGTFTDVSVVRDGRVFRGKAETTAYDLRVGFRNAVEAAAERLGLSQRAILEQAEDIVYSTTIGTNSVVEHKGPRLGLMITHGFEDTLHVGRARQWADGLPPEQRRDRGRARRPAPLVPRDLVVGVRERVDPGGGIVMPLQDGEVVDRLRYLVDRGVRGIVVVLLYSYVNPVHELRIRELVRREYPESYVGYLPVFLSHEVSPQMGEYRRAMTTLLDAYLRVAVEGHLLELADDLRDDGYRRPLFIAKCTGGTSSLSRSRPIHLFGSGPVASVIASGSLARRHGLKHVAVTDMGGTSFDVGLIVDGRDRIYDFDPVIDRWRVQVPLVAHWSIGAGGGSIARVEDGRLRVGPQSAGALPGPACYARGGEEPTVTDADVALGYVDPEYFLAGRIRLDAERGLQALQRYVAEPLGVPVTEAAWGVRQLVDGVMGQEIYRIVALASGYDPREFALYAFGGAGPVHAAGYAGYADISRVATFGFGSVSGAFGTLHLDLLQVYERSLTVIVLEAGGVSYHVGALPEINRAIAELRAEAARDIEEENLDLPEIRFELEIFLRFGQQRRSFAIPWPHEGVEGESDLRRLVGAFVSAYGEAYGRGSVFLEAGVQVVGLRLNATAPRGNPAVERHPATPSASEALKGRRRAYWGPQHGWVDTPVYQRERLAEGLGLPGPALVEAEDTVCVVPPGWRASLDSLDALWLVRTAP